MDQLHAQQCLVRKLESIADVSHNDKAALSYLPVAVVKIREGQDIVRQGDRAARSCIVMDGLACTSKMTGFGKRQISSLHVAGDMPDLQSLHLLEMDSTISALTSCVVGFVEHDALRRTCENFPGLTHLFWRASLVEAAIYREWVTNLGQRDALARVAHVLCEMFVRMKAVGLTEGLEFEFPVTQTHLGEATGMSAVHVNRTLKELRASGLIEWKTSHVTILDWHGLARIGDFDTAYLHLKKAARIASLSS